MGIDGTTSNQSLTSELPLPDAYRVLNDQRIDIDRRIEILAPDDPARDVLWQELESVLASVHALLGNLTQSPATQLSDLRAKAAVLAHLLRFGTDGGGPEITDNEKSALALSLSDDIAHWPAEPP
jgi:hypothetical protein